MPLTHTICAACVLAAASVLVACAGRSKSETLGRDRAMAAPAGDDTFSLVPVGAYVAIEATRKDVENIKENDPECFVWPKTCVSNATVFVEGAGAQEPLEALQLDAGIYEVALTYGSKTSDEASKWRGKAIDVRVDAIGTLAEVVTVSPDGREMATFVVRLQAQTQSRPDGPICDWLDPRENAVCSPEDQHYRCSHGSYLAYGCSKSALYADLQRQLCADKRELTQSQFAAGFNCAEVAYSEVLAPM